MDKSEAQEPLTQPQKECSACSAKSLSEDAKVNKSEKRQGRNACSTCTSDLPYVYALGRIEARFPNKSIEKEYVQAVERSKSADFTSPQAFYSVLSKPENRYLVRKLSWILTIEDVPIYIILPNGPMDLDILLEAIRPSTCPLDIGVIIGRKGPIASRDMCGLDVPLVFVDQIYCLEYSNFVKSINLKSLAEENFKAAVAETFRRMMQIAHNTGATDKHRALNYLAVRYPTIYTKSAEEHERNFSLTSVEAISSRLSDSRKIISVVFSFTNRETGSVEKYFIRVDVSEEFPFLVTNLSPYYDR